MCFVKILFHLLEVAVGIDFMREKKLFLTCFTHHKFGLWKSCELDLERKLFVNCSCDQKESSKSVISVLKNPVQFTFRNVYTVSQTTLLVLSVQERFANRS
jgi:hypothetical protein